MGSYLLYWWLQIVSNPMIRSQFSGFAFIYRHFLSLPAASDVVVSCARAFWIIFIQARSRYRLFAFENTYIYRSYEHFLYSIEWRHIWVWLQCQINGHTRAHSNHHLLHALFMNINLLNLFYMVNGWESHRVPKMSSQKREIEKDFGNVSCACDFTKLSSSVLIFD